jgi:hypothetical protein
VDNPNYILEFKDSIPVPKNETTVFLIIKTVHIILLFIVLIDVIFFKDALRLGGSFGFWSCFIIVGLYVLKEGGFRMTECPAQLWFYDDYMIKYVPHNYYSKNSIRREYSKLYYKDAKECWNRVNSKKIEIHGMMELTYFDYNKDGTLKEKPSFAKTCDFLIRFYTYREPDIDFVKEIEAHSPLKMEIRNS